MTDYEKQVEFLVDHLECSIVEAQEILKSDQEVNKMTVRECESDMTKEQKAYAKKHRQGVRKHPPVYNFNKREQKVDTQKMGLMERIAEFIKSQEDCADYVQTKNGQGDFLCEGRKMRIVLSAPRK